jgi:hypothetical protein
MQGIPIKDNYSPSDIAEDNMGRTMPRILEILLIDRTTSHTSNNKNIIWANDNYKEYGEIPSQMAGDNVRGKRPIWPPVTIWEAEP